MWSDNIVCCLSVRFFVFFMMLQLFTLYACLQPV